MDLGIQGKVAVPSWASTSGTSACRWSADRRTAFAGERLFVRHRGRVDPIPLIGTAYMTATSLTADATRALVWLESVLTHVGTSERAEYGP